MTLVTAICAGVVFTALVVCLCAILSANDTLEEAQDDLRLQAAALRQLQADAERRRAEQRAASQYGGEA